MEQIDDVLVLLDSVVKQLVDLPEQVELNVVKGRHSVLVEAIAVREDRKHLIGRSGRTAVALRTLFGAMLARQGVSFDLKIIEE
jgi:predicted RNA-binding protein YlqC (UPF0109 family)